MAVLLTTSPSTPTCPYCKQPLLDREAMRALRESEAELNRRISEVAAESASHLAATEIAKVREQAAAQNEAWERELAALKDQQREAWTRRLRQLEKETTEKAERKASGRLRSLERTLEKTVGQKEELERRLEQIGAADRGGFHEDDVLRALRDAFPDDRVEKRGKGGDILQEVIYRAGGDRTSAGLIVYECKDTIHWSSAFVDEAKAAAEEHRTPNAIVVTKAFPAKRKDFFVRDGVVIVHPAHAVELVRLLRTAICEIHRAALSAERQAEKSLALYRYLTSDDFRQRFVAIASLDQRLKGFLSAERKAHQRTWEKREACYNDLALNAAAIDQRIRNVIERPRRSKHSRVVHLEVS